VLAYTDRPAAGGRHLTTLNISGHSIKALNKQRHGSNTTGETGHSIGSGSPWV